MSQKNMGRLAQDMKRELIAIIGRLKDPRLEGGLLTVTRLDVTPDLDVAKVYVSVMGRPDGPKPAIEALNRAAGHVRTEVSKKMHIRKAPRFIFVDPGCPSDKRNLRNRLWQAGRDNDTDHNGTSSQLPKDLGRVPAVFACSGKAAAYVGL